MARYFVKETLEWSSKLAENTSQLSALIGEYRLNPDEF